MSDSDRSWSNSSSTGAGGTNGAGSDETEFGKLVLKHNLASPNEVKECLEIIKSRTNAGEKSATPLSRLLVEKGYVTSTQCKRLLSEYENRASSKQQIPGYQILGKLGKGAMATVYKARQVSLDRIVAVKVLPKRFTENAEFVDRFYREGKAAAKLNHANIVQAIDVNEADGYHYFVMEYVDGFTVHDKLGKNQRYSEEEALDLITQIADALAHSHARGLIHRDVKPKNIMIARDGVAKLADMGLAREVSDTQLAQAESGRAYGTPYYISPEQIRGEVEIDFRADIYSLGATFYHMVTGRVPYDADSPTNVMLKHLREQLTPPDHINPELSIGCAEIIEAMMAKDRNDRYQSTQELVDDLKMVRNGEPPVHARRIFDMSQLADLDGGNEVVISQSEGSHGTASSDVTVWKVAFWMVLGVLFLSLVFNIIQAIN